MVYERHLVLMAKPYFPQPDRMKNRSRRWRVRWVDALGSAPWAAIGAACTVGLLTGCVAALPLAISRNENPPTHTVIETTVEVAPAVTATETARSTPSDPAELNGDRKAATGITSEKNQTVYQQIDFANEQEVEFAERGLIAAPDHLELKDADGNVIWSQKAFEFIEGVAPDTANPSLWRNTQLNHNYGLFEVTDGIYQVRGYDISNLTLIAGDTGWIIFDPLTNVETAKAALQLANDNLGARPVVAVVISHSHGDHFGGIRGVLGENTDVPIIVPDGFMEHAVAENICGERDEPARELHVRQQSRTGHRRSPECRPRRGHAPWNGVFCPAERHHHEYR